jgi:hypothetical protein
MQPPWGISAASTIETVILTFILGEYARDPKAHYTIKTGSPMTEFDRSDREEWNRRGYVRGAWHLYRALIPHLSEDARQIAYQWITTDLPNWSAKRVANR